MKNQFFTWSRAGLLSSVFLFWAGCGSSETGPDNEEATGTSGTSSNHSTGTQATSSGSGGGGGGGEGGGQGGEGGAPCEKTAYYCDGDFDGHGFKNAVVEACEKPRGGDDACPGVYVTSGDDCAPNDNSAYPGQTVYTDVPAKEPLFSLPFDYNCDGVEERDPSQLFKSGSFSDQCSKDDCSDVFNIPEGFTFLATCGSGDGYVVCEDTPQGCSAVSKPAPAPLRCR